MSGDDGQAECSDDLGLGNIGRAIADEVVIEYFLEILGGLVPLRISRAKMEAFTIGSEEVVLNHISKSPRFPGDSAPHLLAANNDFVKRVRYWKRRMNDAA